MGTWIVVLVTVAVVVAGAAVMRTRLLADGGASDVAVVLRRELIAAIAAVCVAAVWAVVFAVQNETTSVPVPAMSYLLLVPLLAGVVYALASSAVVVSWPRVSGPVRSAQLQSRVLAQLVTRADLLIHVAAVALFVVVTAGGAVLSRDGLSLAWGWNEGSGTFVGVVVNSMFPGARITAPLAVALAVVLAATWFGIWLVVRRPSLVGAVRAEDLALRRISIRRTLGLSSASIIAVDGGLIALAGAGVSTAFPDEAFGHAGSVVGYVGFALAATAIVVGVLAFVRRPRAEVDEESHG